MGKRSGGTPKKDRVTTSSDETSKKARKSGGGVDVEAWELRMSSDEAQSRIANSPWWDKIMAEFDAQMLKHRSPEKFMCSEWPDTKLSDWARAVEAHFPSVGDAGYMKADDGWESGRKRFRAWEVSWKLNSGNSGFVDLPKFRNLLMLVLAFGPETDPELPGTELPIISKPDARFTDGSGCFTGAPAPKELKSLGIHGIHTVKSYKRFLAINTAIALMIKTETVDEYKKSNESSPGFLNRFAIMHGMVLDKDATALLDLNRGTFVR